MHALVNFLIVVLVSLLSQLPNRILVEARKLTSNGFLRVDLIHRDSPLSPFYNSSMTLGRTTLGSVSLGHHIHLSSTYYDNKNAKTDIIPNGGDYLMKIGVGTPPVELMAVVDTGGDLIWLQCSPCQHCIPQGSPLFDPKKSSTYHPVPCNSQSCNYTNLDTSCIPNYNNNNASCIYTVSYGDGTKSTGVLTTDTFSFPSTDAASVSFPSSIFGCGYGQSGHLGIHGDGIIGLGMGTLSLISQLGPNVNNKFSYCLAPLSSGVTSKLTFGLDVTGPGVVSTPFTNDDPPLFYYLTLDGISIGNNSIPVGQNVVIDSGTTLTFLPTDVYGGVKTALKGGIMLNPMPDPDQEYDLCYNVQPSSKGFNPPNAVFHFKGAEVVLKALNTFRLVRNLTCLAMVPSDDSFIFGNVAQVNFEVGYDLKAKRVSFAPADCSKN